MSYLAIGAVTKSMAELLSRKLNKPALLVNPSFRVTALPPDDDRVSADYGVNLFLYRVGECPFSKNMNWRGDRANPITGNLSALPLILHYLLTAYSKRTDGAQDDIFAHQLLGNAVAVLHDFPVLNDIHDADFDADQDQQFPPELRNSFEKVKITMLPVAMEEFSKIWTGLNRAYRLSVAYEVSLVQIAPIIPASGPAPRVQLTAVETQTIGVPQVVEVSPAQGPVLTLVSISGQALQQAGTQTLVTVGDTDLSESDLTNLSPTEITFRIPELLSAGPDVPITVSVGGRESTAVVYRVSPWISRIVPLRGIPGIPVTIDFEVPAGANISAEIDGQAVAATVDAQRKTVSAIVPQAIASNGPKSVVLILNDGAAKRSNALSFEVLPLITDLQVATTKNPDKTTLTFSGERLNGTAVAAQVGSLLLTKQGGNNTAAELVIQVPRLLPATSPATAVVDGRTSNTLPPRLDEVIPNSAFSGDTVMLSGSSLSGRSVSVGFGGTAVDVGAQPFSARFNARVPTALAAGVIQVKVTVDGRDTNNVAFTVSG